MDNIKLELIESDDSDESSDFDEISENNTLTALIKFIINHFDPQDVVNELKEYILKNNSESEDDDEMKLKVVQDDRGFYSLK
jgi:hypothetical protein